MNNKLCLIENDKYGYKYTIYDKLLDSPKKNKINNKYYILDFIINDFKFSKKDYNKYKIK